MLNSFLIVTVFVVFVAAYAGVITAPMMITIRTGTANSLCISMVLIRNYLFRSSHFWKNSYRAFSDQITCQGLVANVTVFKLI